MNHPDRRYIAGLTRKASLGCSDAFAELYASTFQNQYQFSYACLQDTYLAQQALQDTYTRALKDLDSLQDPMLFLPWLSYLGYQACFRLKQEAGLLAVSSVSIAGQDYSFRQLQKLPFTEALLLSLHYFEQMPVSRMARLLHMRRGTVSRYLRQGIHRLRTILNL